MTARNDITGDAITTKQSSDAYRTNYDAIFRNKGANGNSDPKDRPTDYDISVNEGSDPD